jgi:hypothetical protein
MSTRDNTPIDHNKDSGNNSDNEPWSDNRIEIAIFNQLMDADDRYIGQATEKFTYFRLTSDSVFFDIDLEDLSEEVINQLEICTKNYKTKEEKYNRLDSIIVQTIFLVYKNSAGPKILSTTKEDSIFVKSALNEIPSLTSHKWRLVDSSQKVPVSRGLSELIGYAPPPPSSLTEDEELDEIHQYFDNNESSLRNGDDGSKTKTQSDRLMEVADKVIDLLFKDQHNEPFAKIFVKDHFEIISLKSQKFARFLCNSYHEKHGTAINSESINSITRTLQAKAEFGDKQFNLSLRVAEYGGDFYYDLTNEKHQCVRISKEGKWEVLDQTPVPLFRRYNQSPQDLPDHSLTEHDEQNKDPLEAFFSKLTNIKDSQTKLLAKVALISYFVPNIPHVVMIIHGDKGSAKSTFQLFVKNIVDPAKPPPAYVA